VFVLVVGLLLSFSASGCRTSSPPVDFETKLSGTLLANDDARAERVLRAYLELSNARTAMRGSARVALEGPDFKLNRPQRILVERPARLRFEIVGLFDQIAAMLAVKGGEFGFFDASTGQVSHGRVTSSLLWDLAKIDLEIPEVVELLLGVPRPSPGLSRASNWLEVDGRIVLVFAWTDRERPAVCADAGDLKFFDPGCFVSTDTLALGGELFYFDVAGRLVELRSLDSGGVIRYRVTFEDYQAVANGDSNFEFPNRTTIHSPGANSVARFDWKRVMFAEQLSDRFFEIRRRDESTRGG
jgi:hypothetical protein